MITEWILVLHLMTTNGHDALSGVAPFKTKSDCLTHAAHLFNGWHKVRESEEHLYHRMDSMIHYIEIHEGEWVSQWSCVPSIPHEWGLHNIPK